MTLNCIQFPLRNENEHVILMLVAVPAVTAYVGKNLQTGLLVRHWRRIDRQISFARMLCCLGISEWSKPRTLAMKNASLSRILMVISIKALIISAGFGLHGTQKGFIDALLRFSVWRNIDRVLSVN